MLIIKSLYIARRVLFANIPMMLMIMAMALAFTFIFGNLLVADGGGTPTYNIALVIQDEGSLAADFSRDIAHNPRLQAANVTEDEARRLVMGHNVLLAVLVPQGFTEDLLAGRGPKLTFLRDEENNLFMAARQEIERELTRTRAAVATANRLSADTEQWDTVYHDTLTAWQTPPVTVQTSALGEVQDNGERQMDRTGMGMTVMFVMITVISASGAILDERNQGTWQRMIAAPAPRSTILGGYLLSYFALGVLQFSILLIMSRFVMGVSWPNLLGVAVVTVVFLLSSISLGLFIAGMVRTFQQQQAVSALVVTATSMLGGLFWPIDIVSPLMQTMARITPQYWAMRGYEQLLFAGLDWSALQQPLLVLLGFAGIFFALGMSRIKFA
ncbi:ABC transporter permease [Dethiobacter alkaliphilus]|uniref:ABC-2 type transporter n=1 Tax=Dethiobacter alkaliphilus AHT 1 TaxID=555088 RepID=C0GCV8_DETAL|nr:ABC transporter permease [Dethiobacter alkaliphilus]EEG79043.1 ABC-2 type transporter [Dethiobacter alkaliphilus AHT 1]